MKKFFLFTMALLALVFNAPAQEAAALFYDFEDSETDYGRFYAPAWANSEVIRVTNPAPSGINTSAFVLGILNPNIKTSGGFMLMSLNKNGYTTQNNTFDRLQFKYYRGEATTNKVFIEFDGDITKRTAPMLPLSTEEGWQVVEFEMPPKTYQSHAFRLFYESQEEASAVYIDDVRYYDSSVPTSVESMEIKSEALVYPNPSNGLAELAISTAHAGTLKVCVYSITGQLIQCIANGYYSSGSYKLPLSISDSGLYIVSIIKGQEQTQIKYVVN